LATYAVCEALAEQMAYVAVLVDRFGTPVLILHRFFLLFIGLIFFIGFE